MKSGDEPMSRMGDVAEKLADHVRNCDECAGAGPPVTEIAAKLGAGDVDLDVAGLSASVMQQLGPQMARRRQAFAAMAASEPSAERRRAAFGMLAAFASLVVVAALDAFFLRAFYDWASPLLPAGVAAYLVVSYGAMLALLFGATYAVIPLALAQRRWANDMVTAEVMS